MRKHVDLEQIREGVLRRKKAIDEELKALDLVEHLAARSDSAAIQYTDEEKESELSSPGITESCEKLFAENPNKKFLVKDVMQELQKGGLQPKGKNPYSTLASTLNRLAGKKDYLEKKKLHNKTLYKLKQKPSIDKNKSAPID